MGPRPWLIPGSVSCSSGTGTWLLLRALALVYLVASVSLALQVRGLAGPKGHLPVGEYLAWIRLTLGSGLVKLSGGDPVWLGLTALSLSAFDDAAWWRTASRVPSGSSVLFGGTGDGAAGKAARPGGRSWRRRGRQAATALLLAVAVPVGLAQVLRAGGMDARVPAGGRSPRGRGGPTGDWWVRRRVGVYRPAVRLGPEGLRVARGGVTPRRGGG